MIKGVSSVGAGGRICEVQSERGIPLRIPIPIPSNTWIDLQIRVFYLVIAVWVLVAYRKAPSRVHRLFFFLDCGNCSSRLGSGPPSVVTTEARSSGSTPYRHDAGLSIRYVGYSLSLLVDSRSTRTPRRPPDKRDAVVRAIYGMAFSR